MSGCARSDRGCGRCDKPLDFDFTMAFQPIVDLGQRRIHGYEALVRGVNGESALSILEKVDEASRYRFDQLCRTRAIRLAHQLNLRGMLSINFLPNAVYDPDACLAATLDIANEVGWSPERICFEITETEEVESQSHLEDIVSTYRSKGFSVAIDDFGTGYANFEVLLDMRPNVLKIDRCFVTGIDQDLRRQTISRAMLMMAQSLDLTVVAEGIETVAEARWLYGAGITRHQGFLYARPMVEALPQCAPHSVEQACSLA